MLGDRKRDGDTCSEVKEETGAQSQSQETLALRSVWWLTCISNGAHYPFRLLFIYNDQHSEKCSIEAWPLTASVPLGIPSSREGISLQGRLHL